MGAYFIFLKGNMGKEHLTVCQQTLDKLIKEKANNYYAVALYLVERTGIGLSAEAITGILLVNSGKIPLKGVGSNSLIHALLRVRKTGE